MGVSEDHHIDRLLKFACQKVPGRAGREVQIVAVGAGPDVRAGPLDIVNHADGYTFSLNHPGCPGQTVSGFDGVFVASHRQHRRHAFQNVQNSQALQVAAVEYQVYTLKGVQYLRREVFSGAGGVGIGDEADLHVLGASASRVR